MEKEQIVLDFSFILGKGKFHSLKFYKRNLNSINIEFSIVIKRNSSISQIRPLKFHNFLTVMQTGLHELSKTFQPNVNTPKKMAGPNSRKIKFTKAEDKRLAELVSIYDDHAWDKVAKHMPSRTPRQCRERWTNYVNPIISQRPWTHHEDHLLMIKQNKYGNKWKSISRFFPDRSKNSIKYRWLLLSGSSTPSKKQISLNLSMQNVQMEKFNNNYMSKNNSIVMDNNMIVNTNDIAMKSKYQYYMNNYYMNRYSTSSQNLNCLNPNLSDSMSYTFSGMMNMSSFNNQISINSHNSLIVNNSNSIEGYNHDEIDVSVNQFDNNNRANTLIPESNQFNNITNGISMKTLENSNFNCIGEKNNSFVFDSFVCNETTPKDGNKTDINVSSNGSDSAINNDQDSKLNSKESFLPNDSEISKYTFADESFDDAYDEMYNLFTFPLFQEEDLE
ncbi:hypothetical protein TRFO_25188 [Tritrichomonas foetus]|uniref:Myb-like DNA-binding domain containing protein n=1 Tax=Tritrichomonas foetus TaxID=1144522 RepID=A0A1J4KB19_9EUKA|nr:hypothetical protein TRFO_25188 [Tritrichomonas foetus]|eukprot:OHT06661.1 hypothetical protein TRFO_25188 [Tritrichomonas foetus]